MLKNFLEKGNQFYIYFTNIQQEVIKVQNVKKTEQLEFCRNTTNYTLFNKIQTYTYIYIQHPLTKNKLALKDRQETILNINRRQNLKSKHKVEKTGQFRRAPKKHSLPHLHQPEFYIHVSPNHNNFKQLKKNTLN